MTAENGLVGTIVVIARGLASADIGMIARQAERGNPGIGIQIGDTDQNALGENDHTTDLARQNLGGIEVIETDMKAVAEKVKSHCYVSIHASRELRSQHTTVANVPYTRPNISWIPVITHLQLPRYRFQPSRMQYRLPSPPSRSTNFSQRPSLPAPITKIVWSSDQPIMPLGARPRDELTGCGDPDT